MNKGKPKPPDLTSPDRQRFKFDSLTSAMLSPCVCGQEPAIVVKDRRYSASHKCGLLAVTIKTGEYRTIERGKVARDWNHFIRSLLNLAQHGRKVPGS